MFLLDGVDTPNDLCFGPDGRLYFTDPRGESVPTDPASAQPGRLYSCEVDGSDLTLLLEGPRFINGLAFDADGALYIVESSHPHRVLHVGIRDGHLDGEPVEVIRLDAGFPDGIALDADGNVWVAATSAHAIQVYSPSGGMLASFDCGAESLPTNLCFSVTEPSGLYVAASGAGAVLRRDVDVRGMTLHGGSLRASSPGW